MKKKNKKEEENMCGCCSMDNIWNIGLLKLAVAAFVLMIAKLWSPILGLAWYWYLAIAIIAAIKPIYSGCCCKEYCE